MATAIQKLDNEDIRAIFESLHDNKPPPPGLNFQIVPVDSDGLRLSPPAHEYEDGIYVLLRPDKSKLKKKSKKNDKQEKDDRPRIPPHLAHLKMKTPLSKNCTWSLSGPQFPKPTAIQQRYCYPQGNAEYASKKGGSMWTMYNCDGKEDDEYRLLHVYYSIKRANNISSASGASKQLSSKSKKHFQRKRVAVAVEKGTKKQRRVVSKPHFRSVLPTARRPALPLTKKDQIFRRSFRNVPPNTTSASSEVNNRDLSKAGSFGIAFEGHSIHPVPSILYNDDYNHGEYPPYSPNSMFPHNVQENYPPQIATSRESQFQSSQDFARDIDMMLGIPLADPSSMMKEPNAEWSTLMDPVDTNLLSSPRPKTDERYPEVLMQKLRAIHKEIIHEWIDCRPHSERGRLVSVIASWARSISKSPLEVGPSNGKEECRETGTRSERKKVSLKVKDWDKAVEV